ncbi:Hypothetical_protein [Hexamita inflata]|uniref:Hypothetical_protein n=1 Tax=Hexamita inflata TaxID=28002 RepID=A0AA86V1K2_9EUKA|nr:Hypothetical protein HINF_LOCUS60391 [Hexamita inflata]
MFDNKPSSTTKVSATSCSTQNSSTKQLILTKSTRITSNLRLSVQQSAITPIQNSDSEMLTVTPTQPAKRMLHSEEELLKIEQILRFFAVCDLSFEKVKIPFVQHFLGKIRGPDLGPLCTTTPKRHANTQQEKIHAQVFSRQEIPEF